jgi:hypothetical protein
MLWPTLERRKEKREEMYFLDLLRYKDKLQRKRGKECHQRREQEANLHLFSTKT